MYWVWNDRRNTRYDPFFKSDNLLTFKCVGVQNNNKRKESTRVREVCSNCQFFLAKQVHFHLASGLSKFRVKTRNRKFSKMDNRKDAETGSG